MKLYRKIGNGGSLPFETVIPINTTTTTGSKACTPDFTTNTITATAHGFNNGDRVALCATTTPAGLSTSTLYYVINAALDTFQLSTSLGGGVTAFTTNGAGVLVGEVTVFWSMVLPVQTIIEVEWNVEVKESSNALRRGYFIADSFCYRDAGTMSLGTTTSQSSQYGGGTCTDAKPVLGASYTTNTVLFNLLGADGLTLEWQGYLKYKIIS